MTTYDLTTCDSCGQAFRMRRDELIAADRKHCQSCKRTLQFKRRRRAPLDRDAKGPPERK